MRSDAFPSRVESLTFNLGALRSTMAFGSLYSFFSLYIISSPPWPSYHMTDLSLGHPRRMGARCP
ncbi:uncharacterized protein BJX67DRAFT_117358 [Aspergillus lucknowensis]|uniref:Uncharacterized protein n=1 Tax=Aspergillus lucknowensis TaxID=176173 RepID=A0ABR4LQM8_9EURO